MNYAAIIFIVFICVLIFGVQYFYRYHWSRGPQAAFQDLLSKTDEDNDIIASYACKLSFLSLTASRLYIMKNRIRCTGAKKILFDLPTSEIVETTYSYWSLQFRTRDGHSYKVGALIDPDQFGATLLFYNQSATNPDVLKQVVLDLQQAGLSPISK